MGIEEKIQWIIDWWIQDWEIPKIKELKEEFSCLSPEKKVEVTKILDAAIAGAEANAKVALRELKNSVCEVTDKAEFSFEKLSERGELSELKKSFEIYFAALAEKELSTLSITEKENTKILFWRKFLGIFSSEGSIGAFLNSVQWKVENAIGKLQGIEEEEAGNKSLSEMFAEAKKLFGDFFAGNVVWENITEYLNGVFKSDIEKIKKAKQENRDISDLGRLNTILVWTSQWERSKEDIYSEIQSQAASLADSFKEKKALGTTLASTIESLPFDLGTSVKNFIRWIIEGSPFLGFLVGIIMGPDFLKSFLSEEDSGKKESLKKLETLSLEDNSPLKWVFSVDFIKNINIKKLEGFFSFMKSQEIDTTSDDFWQGLLSGKTENPKLQKIYSLLKTKHGEKILNSKDETNGGKGFYDKLNSIEALSNREETQKAEIEFSQQAAALPSLIWVTTVLDTAKQDEDSTKNTNTLGSAKDTLPEDITRENPIITPEKKAEQEPEKTTPIEQYTKFRDTALKLALTKSMTLPIEVSYSGKDSELLKLGILVPKKIDFIDGKLSLDGKAYSPKFESFQTQGYTVNHLHIVGGVSFSGEMVKLQYETEDLEWWMAGIQKWDIEIKKEMLFDIISWILKDEKYIGKIPANGDIPEIEFSLS